MPSGAQNGWIAWATKDCDPLLGKGCTNTDKSITEPVVYDTVGGLLADARSGKWDVALLAADPARRADFEFSRPFALTQNTYLVRAGSGLMTIPDLDRKGVKIAVSVRSAQHNYLKANLKGVSVPAN